MARIYRAANATCPLFCFTYVAEAYETSSPTPRLWLDCLLSILLLCNPLDSQQHILQSSGSEDLTDADQTLYESTPTTTTSQTSQKIPTIHAAKTFPSLTYQATTRTLRPSMHQYFFKTGLTDCVHSDPSRGKVVPRPDFSMRIYSRRQLRMLSLGAMSLNSLR